MTVRSVGGGSLLVVLAAFGALAAWAVPQSVGFPIPALLRVAVVLGVTAIGATVSSGTGLAVWPHGGSHPLVRGAAIGLAFGVYAAVLEATVFHGHVPLPPAIPPWQRIAVLVPLVVVDELVYRLGLVSLLAWLLGARPNTATGGRFRLAIVAVAVLYVPLHLAQVTGGGPFTPMLAVHELVVHVAAGCLWGWLFWRNGLVTAIAAHAGAHVTLQIGLG